MTATKELAGDGSTLLAAGPGILHHRYCILPDGDTTPIMGGSDNPFRRISILDYGAYGKSKQTIMISIIQPRKRKCERSIVVREQDYHYYTVEVGGEIVFDTRDYLPTQS